MVLTNKEGHNKKLIHLQTHGITRDKQFMEGESDGPWYYQQIELGMNYRMTDIQAALGLRQLDRIDESVVRRRELVRRYHELLGGRCRAGRRRADSALRACAAADASGHEPVDRRHAK